MGEHSYPILIGQRIIKVRFDEMNDDYGCLCTFPHNYCSDPDSIDMGTVRDLAIFGASVAYLCNHYAEDEYFYIPNDVPTWIREGIDKALKYQPPSP